MFTLTPLIKFLFEKLKRPNFSERKDIWNDVLELYPHLETGKIPFKGAGYEK